MNEVIFIFPLWVYVSLIVLMIWDLVWRGMALWSAAKKNRIRWFVALLIFNTMGILPIVYLGFFEKSSKVKKIKKR